jgi:Tol biopolymer transport system component
MIWRFTQRQLPRTSLRVVRLTSYPGQVRQPAFSLEGKQIAFAWNGETQDNHDIYVKFLDRRAALTSHRGVDGWPAWSPDGRKIAFLRWVRGEPDIDVLTVPALGGPERKILQFRIRPRPAANFPVLCWTQDGKGILIGHTSDPNAPQALALVSVETLEVRLLTRPGSGDCCPAITPNGRRLAFLRTSAGRIPNVYFLSLGPDYRPEGEPRQLTHEPLGATNPMWTGDGREVLYLSSREGVRTLWRVPREGSRPASPIESLAGRCELGDLARGTGWHIDRPRGSGIWRVDLPGGKRPERITCQAPD